MKKPEERFLRIDAMIRSGTYPSVQNFMETFGISQRSVYQDIQYLKDHFQAPIAYSRLGGGYYYTRLDWRMVEQEARDRKGTEPPTTWLWQEITRRFGAEAASDLRRSFKEKMKHYERAQRLERYRQEMPRLEHRLAQAQAQGQVTGWLEKRISIMRQRIEHGYEN